MKPAVAKETEPESLGPVLSAELKQINQVRRERTIRGTKFNQGQPRKPFDTAVAGGVSQPQPAWQTRDTGWVSTIADAHNANLTGLALSGGGVRSATFNLGVLQALADLNLLSRIDYLSTVSGGGYIGGWLAAWTKRVGSFAEVQRRLATKRVNQEEDKEPEQIRFLRMFSNYLTPKVGVFSADTWGATGIILRNILLNLVVLLSSLVAVLLLPRAAVQWATTLQNAITNHEMWVGVVFGVLLLVALTMTTINMIYLDAKKRSLWTQQRPILCLVAGPVFTSMAFGALWQTSRFKEMLVAIEDGAVAYGAIWLLAAILGALVWWLQANPEKVEDQSKTPEATAQKMREKPWTLRSTLTMLVAAVPAGALAGWLYGELSGFMNGWTVAGRLTFGAPLVLAILLLAATLHIGLMGTEFPDRRREWCGRLGGWLLLVGIVWMTILWVALYFPHFFDNPPLWVLKPVKKYLTPAWILTTAGGVLAGKGDTSGKPGELNWKDWVAKAAPYIFVAGLVCWVSWGINQVFGDGRHLYAAIAGCAAVAAVMAWRVDINQFSMHQMYRNRLVSCYLGASNTGRSPNRFTGLDKTDELALKDLRQEKGYDGPYPVLNAALNLVKGQDLAWQERKAESFVMTPLYCGYDVWLEEQDSPLLRGDRQEGPGNEPALGKSLRRFGYRKTEEYAFPAPRWQGLFLGTAMGISGAAASPNMGFYTSAPVAFLMTVFNVRLGQWLGNPRHTRTFERPTPRWGLTYLLNELFAGTTDDAAYVYLSDGGHFDNMALYEMVKRRCGLIIVCDAEADCNYEYGGLANAIRKCQIDMGIDIDLDLTTITPQRSTKLSKKHCAVGTIHYENADLNAPTGTIIYIKASLTGDEPADVENYKKQCCAFPHESTIDQWFSESQFESYRKLGYHAVLSSFQGSGSTGAGSTGQAPVAPSWLSTAATVVSDALSSLASGASHQKSQAPEPPALAKQLGTIFERFGFDISPSHPAPGSAVPGAAPEG